MGMGMGRQTRGVLLAGDEVVQRETKEPRYLRNSTTWKGGNFARLFPHVSALPLCNSRHWRADIHIYT